MFLSKRSNGIYYIWFVDEIGRKQKVSTHRRLKSEALKFLQKFRESEREHKIRLQRTLFSQFAEDFLSYSKSVHTPKTQKAFQVAFREFVRLVGDRPLHKIGIRDIENFLSVKKSEASEWTARKYYIALASALETAKRWGCTTNNPFRKVEKPKVRELQPVFFTKPEFQMLLRSIEGRDFREFCICSVSTGLRLAELTPLQWNDVDFVRKVIFVRNSEVLTTKNKRNRVVPMNEQLWQMLALRKENAACELVFHRNGKRLTEGLVSSTFKKHVRLAALSDKLHFHSLRHTFATWLVQEGVPIYEVQKLLGHSSISVTQVYSHLAASELHGAVNKIQLVMN